MLTFPAGAPSVDGTRLTVDSLLKAPTVLQKRIITPSQNFLSDELFRPGTTDSGAVIFSKAKKQDIYPSRGEIQQIEPGARYPMVDIEEGGDEVALATKFGAGYIVTDEAKRRNNLNVIAKGNLKLRNAMLRQDAYRCLAAFNEAVPTINASAPWSTARAMREDILRNTAAIRSLGLGYSPDTVIISPNTATELLLLEELDALLPRENASLNPLYNPTLSGLLQMKWLVNEFAADDEAIILQTKMTGANIVEVPFNVEVEREGTRKRDVVLADKWSVPIIDEPESALVIKGVNPTP